LSIAFLIEENPGVAFDGSGNAGARIGERFGGLAEELARLQRDQGKDRE
jgi:hypothetical protein